MNSIIDPNDPDYCERCGGECATGSCKPVVGPNDPDVEQDDLIEPAETAPTDNEPTSDNVPLASGVQELTTPKPLTPIQRAELIGRVTGRGFRRARVWERRNQKRRAAAGKVLLAEPPEPPHPPTPTEDTVTVHGRVYRIWSDGSRRREVA